jgi:hypothetical protein
MTLFRHLTLPILLCAGPAAAAPQFEQLDLLEARIVARWERGSERGAARFAPSTGA